MMCVDVLVRVCMCSQAALCVTLKYWDEGAAQSNQNLKISNRCSIPLEDFNRMEIAFMKGLDWTLAISRENFDAWAKQLEEWGEAASKEQENLRELERRNQSPLLSTDVVERIGSHGSVNARFKSPKLTFGDELMGVGAGSVCTDGGEDGVLRVSSTATDSNGDIITTRLVFPTLPPANSPYSLGRSKSLCLGIGSETILRVGSLESVSMSEEREGGKKILKTVSMEFGAN